MADLRELYNELLAAGYPPETIPDVIRRLAPLAPYNVAGGYGLLSPQVEAARVASQTATSFGQIGRSLLDSLLSTMSNPFSIIPALQVYGALGGTPNIAQAVLQARQGQPAPPIFGQTVADLVKDLVGQVQRGVRPVGQPPAPDKQTMSPRNAVPAMARGGKLVLQEPVIGMTLGGRPVFVAGEAGPEKVEFRPIKRFAGGGTAVVNPVTGPAEEAARLLSGAFAGNKLAQPSFLEALARGQLPRKLPSRQFFRSLPPTLQNALLGYYVQATGGTLRPEDILQEMERFAPEGLTISTVVR